MSQPIERKRALKEALKRLRTQRGAAVRNAEESHKVRLATRKRIRSELAKGPATVPAVAAACALPAAEVLWHVAAMRKYGAVVEDVQEGNYFAYRLVRENGRG